MIIDIVNEIVDDIKTTFSTIEVLTEYPEVQKTFPCIIIAEISNDADLETKDSSGYNHSNVSIEVNVFTKGYTRMTDAKKIRNDIDAIISDEYGMYRAFSDRTPNVDTDIYRWTMRFSTKVDRNKKLFRG